MSKSNAMFIGWNRPFVGRETQALNLFERSMGFYQSLVSDKKIESFEPFFLNAHGGDLNGFVLLRGSADQMAALHTNEQLNELIIDCQYAVDGIGTIDAYTGDEVGPILQQWNKNAQQG